MRHLLRLLLVCWKSVIKPAPVLYAASFVLGVMLRCLTILCFVATLQALLIAAVPDGGGVLARVERWVASSILPGASVNLALMAAALVVLAFLVQLMVQHLYNQVLGLLINSSATSLAVGTGENDLVERRRVATTLATSGVKISEIGAFLFFLCLVILLFSPLALAALLMGGALALAAFVWIRKSELLNKLRLDVAKKSLRATLSAEAVEEYSAADERNRSKKSTAVAVEGFVIGVFTAYIVVIFVVSNITIDPQMAIYAVVLVFSLRYAVIYVREMGRAFSSLLDLRAEKLLK